MSYDQELKYKWDNENARAYRDEQLMKEVALKMKERGYHMEEIAIYTKLPIEEIVAL